MNCKVCRIEIEELDESRALSRSAGAHLESCADCRAFHKEHAALSRLVGSLEVVTAPADFDFRLRARLAAERSVDARHGAWHRFAPGAWSLALAASFVMLIAVGLMVRQVWLAPAASVQTQELANINHDNRNYPVPAPSITAAAPSQSEVPGKFTPPVNVSVSSHPKVRQQANVNRGIDEKEGISSNTSDGNVGGGSNVFAVRSALPSITPPGIPDPLTQPGALVAVPVQTSTKSATLTLSYGRAKPQMLLLRPVTFGAQDVFEQGDDQRTLISSAQGVW